METGLIFCRTIFLIFIFHERILIATSNNADYNDYSTNLLEVRLPMVKVGPPGSYFGFSVAEHRIDSATPIPAGGTESVLLVGAPIYDDNKKEGNVQRPGDVFRCPYTTQFDDCVALGVDVTDNSDNPVENKTDQWLGVNVRSQGPGGLIVTCAHRYRVKESEEVEDIWGLGKCYIIKQNIYDLEFVPGPETKRWTPCSNKDMTVEKYGYCQAGTGLGLDTYVKNEVKETDMYMAIGAPGSHQFSGSTFAKDISVYGLGSQTSIRGTPDDRIVTQGYSGFSISVGNQNSKTEPFFVSGAPRMNGTGVVQILVTESQLKDLAVHQSLYGINLTESFGYETVVIDINGDGLEDIVVGAPMHYDRKELIGGRIYIFLNNGSSGTYFGSGNTGMYNQYIDGPLDSMFGLSLANLRDINGDKAEELVVGAPYENNGEGAVYIFMGQTDGKIRDPIQKITPKTLNKDLKGAPFPNATFGYSLSAGMDMDNNGSPDVLIGAFESNSVILLRTRPIINPTFEITVNPEEIESNTLTCPVQGIDKQCFTVSLVLQYLSPGLFDEAVDVDLLLEADVDRVMEGKSSRVSFRKTQEDGKPLHTVKTRIVLPGAERDVITEEYVLVFEKPYDDIFSSIVIRATVSLPMVNATMPEPGEEVPSLSAFAILDPHTIETKVTLVKFKKRCDQDDGVCITDLRVNAALDLPIGRDGLPIFTYGIQSKINMKLNVDNLLEDAYFAEVIIEKTDILDFDTDSSGICKQDEDNSAIIKCHLGNPFEEKDQKMTTLTFTNKEIKANQGSLDFNITATTETDDQNPANNHKFLTAVVESQTDLKLEYTKDKSQYEVSGQVRGECAMENLEMIGSFVQHNWTVINDGLVEVPEILVTINFPYETMSGKWLLYLTEMPILSGGSSSYCVLPQNSVDVLNLTHPRGKDDNGNVKTCFPRETRRKRREAEVLPTPQAQSKKTLQFKCNSTVSTARCFPIKCYFRNVESKGSTKIVINSRLWNSTFLEDYVDEDVLQIQVQGVVEISNGSYIKEKEPGNDMTLLTMDVYRDFTISPTTPSLQWWIILLAVIGGLLVLILIILCLWKCGFFERKTMNYKYATVEQKAGRKAKKDKTYMADDIHYTGGF
ncbi:integrin alpha-6-like isoform X2 [Antedon mediterranea]|uniref:integrin alpha-6-like isoform X2 n=1 Tax=Antedon mediterranea TaxID=105859 RepID=UPI003AF520D0